MATSKSAANHAVSKQVRLTLVKSKFGRLKSHRACISGLGLKRMHQSVVVADTPENRGMINSVSYLLRVEQV
jgi:large subunit ribosomal protein L30